MEGGAMPGDGVDNPNQASVGPPPATSSAAAGSSSPLQAAMEAWLSDRTGFAARIAGLLDGPAGALNALKRRGVVDVLKNLLQSDELGLQLEVGRCLLKLAAREEQLAGQGYDPDEQPDQENEDAVSAAFREYDAARLGFAQSLYLASMFDSTDEERIKVLPRLQTLLNDADANVASLAHQALQVLAGVAPGQQNDIPQQQPEVRNPSLPRSRPGSIVMAEQEGGQTPPQPRSVAEAMEGLTQQQFTLQQQHLASQLQIEMQRAEQQNILRQLHQVEDWQRQLSASPVIDGNVGAIRQQQQQQMEGMAEGALIAVRRRSEADMKKRTPSELGLVMSPLNTTAVTGPVRPVTFSEACDPHLDMDAEEQAMLQQRQQLAFQQHQQQQLQAAVAHQQAQQQQMGQPQFVTVVNNQTGQQQVAQLVPAQPQPEGPGFGQAFYAPATGPNGTTTMRVLVQPSPNANFINSPIPHVVPAGQFFVGPQPVIQQASPTMFIRQHPQPGPVVVTNPNVLGGYQIVASPTVGSPFQQQFFVQSQVNGSIPPGFVPPGEAINADKVVTSPPRPASAHSNPSMAQEQPIFLAPAPRNLFIAPQQGLMTPHPQQPQRYPMISHHRSMSAPVGPKALSALPIPMINTQVLPAGIVFDGQQARMVNNPGQAQNFKTSPEHPKPAQSARQVYGGEKRCEGCGTTDSPEWRRGPSGLKSLCNACGLRFSRKKKMEARLRAQLIDEAVEDTPDSEREDPMIFSTQPSLQHHRSFSIDTQNTAAGITDSSWRASLASSDDSTQRYSGDYGGLQVEADFMSLSSAGNPLKRSLEDSEDEAAGDSMDYNVDDVNMKDWLLDAEGSGPDSNSVDDRVNRETTEDSREQDLSRRATII